MDKGQAQLPGPSSAAMLMTIPQATTSTAVTTATTTTMPPQQLQYNVGTQPADSMRPGELLSVLPQSSESGVVWCNVMCMAMALVAICVIGKKSSHWDCERKKQ